MNCSMNSTTSRGREKKKYVRHGLLGAAVLYASQEEEEEHGSQNCAWMKSKKGTRSNEAKSPGRL
jgi:hypothetical protein